MRDIRYLAAAAVMGLSVAAALAAKQTVILKSGGRQTGEVTKTADGYEIRTDKGLVVTFRASEVLRVEDAMEPGDEFARRLERTDQKDPEALYHLARWARQNKLPVKAKELLEKVLQLKPTHENARLLHRLVIIELAGPAAGPDKTGPDSSGPAVTGTAKQPKPEDFVTQEDIYRMRLAELRADDRVGVQFRNKVLDRFIESMQGKADFAQPDGERKFRRGSPLEQARYMLEYTQQGDTRIRDDILVQSDPEVFKVFRSQVWPIVSATCAAAKCHGGPEGAGKLKLFALPASNDQAVYTNLYVLHAWEDDGRKLVNRSSPINSMLLQAGLPREIASQDLRHPKEVNPSPYKSEEDRSFQTVRKWLESLKILMPPGYRVDYKLLKDRPKEATEPTPPAGERTTP